MHRAVLVLMIAILTCAPSAGRAQGSAATSTSSSLAAELVKLLEQRALDSVAAADPAHAGRYVAALVYPKVQILAIAAQYSVPQLLNERLLKADYRGTYVELNRAADREGRLFVQDMGADGLIAAPERGSSPDVIYRNGVDSTMFTGDWKALSLSRDTYLEAFTRADEEYAELLRLLLGQLQSTQ